MKLWPLLAIGLFTLAGHLPVVAHEAEFGDVLVKVNRQANAETGTVEAVPPAGSTWRGGVFISLYQDSFRERKVIRRNDAGRYLLEARLPEPGRWGIYLRYGVAQAGYAGNGGIHLPEAGGEVSTRIALNNGFFRDVPGYVQPLGFLTFGIIALLTLLGLRLLLERIRAGQAAMVSER